MIRAGDGERDVGQGWDKLSLPPGSRHELAGARIRDYCIVPGDSSLPSPGPGCNDQVSLQWESTSEEMGDERLIDSSPAHAFAHVYMGADLSHASKRDLCSGQFFHLCNSSSVIKRRMLFL